MLEIIQDPTLKTVSAIEHAFFTRLGGVSKGCYESLNCAYKSKDDVDRIRENQRRAMLFLDRSLSSLAIVKNVHGNDVIVVEPSSIQQNEIEADAMVTRHPHIVLGTVSADCPSILFSDEKAGVIGVAHAGWKGAKKGVVEATVNQMILLGANPQHISAAMSPCILQDSYEVSEDYRQDFLSESNANQDYFKPSQKPNHFLFDLMSYVKDRLLRMQLKSVSSHVALDTYADDRFFSCRRAYHNQQPEFGCQLSCIYIK